MLLRLNLRWSLALLVTVGAIALESIALTSIADAHQVQTSGNVGGTLHIEPNDNPRTGTASRAWFALTRRGGQPIPLSACNCQLAVYAQPRRDGDTPIARPGLNPLSIEGRQGVPAANVTFPRPGAYQMVLSGRPVTSGTFTPFELRFTVTVAR